MKDLLSLGKDDLKTVITAMQEFSLWLTLAVAVILGTAFAIIYFKKKQYLPAFKHFAIGAVVLYSITLVAPMLYLQIARMKIKGELDRNFFLFVGFFAVLLALILTGCILSKYAKKVYNYFTYIAGGVIIVYAAILFAVIPTAGAEYKPKENIGYYILSAVLVLAIITLSFVFGKDKGSASNTKKIAYAGVCVALSFALSYIKLFSMPMGGSVTVASLLPLMLYSYIFGARRGVFAGVLYGVLQCLQSPQFYQPMQILLDYPIAFGAIGLAGIGKKFKFLKGNMFLELIIGMIIAVTFRYVAHVISGYYVFYSWSTMDNALVYSLTYNTFTLVDLAIDIAVGVCLLLSANMRKTIANINPIKTVMEENPVETEQQLTEQPQE